MKVIEGKTASLIRTSAKLGAMAGNCDKKTTNAISKWAWHNGIIFQITDDILDLSSDTQTLGKEAGKDILEGTYTLPVLIALSENKDKVKKILTGIRNSEIELLEVIQEFNNQKISEIIQEKNLTFVSSFGIIVVKGEERFSPI